MNMSTTWYLIKVLPGKERTMTDQFNQQISLGYLNGFKRFLCPTEKEVVVQRKKTIVREKPIYTGYLYFESESPLSEEQLSEFANQSNIMGLMGNKTPVRLSSADVSRIVSDGIEKPATRNHGLQEGDSVLVQDGPFAGFNGTILEITQDKVEVEVKIFGRNNKVSLPLDQIKRIY